VDWWFAFKPTTAAFPSCSTKLTCMFGGDTQSYSGWGLQYILSYGSKGQTTPMKLHSDCLGNGPDPVARTFAQVYSGSVANYVIWNDQFYDDPKLNIQPACVKYCAGPWGHSKGVMAWGEDGTGFIMQVTTPDWPGSGSSSKPRAEQGNTLGCCKDDNVKVAQHFFAMRLQSLEDTKTVLLGLQRASVATDPNNAQLVKLTSGPSELSSLAKGLGKQVLDNLTPVLGTFSVRSQSGKQVRLIAKPSGLNVPPWQMVSSLIGAPLRTASWWGRPEINSTKSGYVPGCWNKNLKPPKEVQIALSGAWQGKTFSLEGRPSDDGNHAKLAHGLSGSTVTVMGDMNQQGSLNGDDGSSCKESQNGRGGLFFVMDDAVLHAGLAELLHGATADYAGSGPSPPSPPSPSPSPPSPPGPSGQCGGAGMSWQSCKQSGCTYVHKADAPTCKVPSFGCYPSASLPSSCHKSASAKLVA